VYDFTVTATLTKEVRKLSVAEKIQLAETLWDEVVAQPAELPVPDAHKRLLDARLAAHLEEPDSAITLNEFRRRLARRL
jgi:putative addiction module component (TIGR02574 family)